MEDQDNVITNIELEHQFGPLSDEPVDEILGWSEQVHDAHLAWTESESFDILDLLSGGSSTLATSSGSRSV